MSNTSGDNALWTFVSQARYGFIIPGTSTYMTVGSSGGHNSGVDNNITQDDGTFCHAYCSLEAADNDNYYWLWDVEDLLSVKAGQKSPHQVVTYEFGELDLPFQTDSTLNEIGGGSYDATNGLLYLSLLRANNKLGQFNNPPIIVAYRVVTPTRTDDSLRTTGVAQIVDALEAYNDDNGSYRVEGGGVNGNGNGWLQRSNVVSYPDSVSGVLIAQGYLADDFVRDPLYSESGILFRNDYMVYSCGDRVGVFSLSYSIEPTTADEQWWQDNDCTRTPIDRFEHTYFVLSVGETDSAIGGTNNGGATDDGGNTDTADGDTPDDTADDTTDNGTTDDTPDDGIVDEITDSDPSDGSSVPETRTGLTAIHRSGQTFLTWPEVDATSGYHVYRHSAPITQANLSAADRLTEKWGPVGSDSSLNVHANSVTPSHFVISNLAEPLTDDTGLFVYTTQPGESGMAYYAVTVVANGSEQTTITSGSNSLGQAIEETVNTPIPVLTDSVNNGGGRLYTQYMDYSKWNPTFNGYAYNYTIALPIDYDPAQTYPLHVNLHAFGGSFPFNDRTDFDWQVIQMYPSDPGSEQGGATHSWWYGYAACLLYTSDAADE